MKRLGLFLLCAALFGSPIPSSAQHPNPPSALPALSPDQARAALDVLNDPAKRAAFAATLTAITKAGATTAEAAKPAPTETTVQGVTIPLAPDSLGAQVLLSASAFATKVRNEAVDALDTVQSLPLLYGWAVVMATNPIARGLLADVGWRVAVVLACAAVVEQGLRRTMRRPILGLGGLASVSRPADPVLSPIRPVDPESVPGLPMPNNDGLARVQAEETEAASPRRLGPSAWTLLKRVPLVLARLMLELVPVAGIAAVGHFMVATGIGGSTVSRLIILAVVDCYAACAALLCVARMLLSPGDQRLRLFHLQDSTATYLIRWTRRLIVIAVVGYAIGEVGLLLGLSEIAHDAMQKGVGLILHLCLAYIVVSNRRPVRQWLRAPAGATGLLARVRNRFARVWHWVALFFLIAGWLIWAVEVPHGFAVALHYFIITTLVLIGARLALLVLLGVADRTMRPTEDTKAAYSAMHARLLVYHPIVNAALRLTIYLLCGLGLLQLYGLNTFLWLIGSTLGLRILSASGTLLATAVLAFGTWEAVNGGVQQYLERLKREAQLAKSARLRTLLPLLRTALMVSIAVMAGLMILSEIGVNIAPLLAGAGIIGVAIGFGSQKLVQDLITGIFLLLENAMQVGDAVTVSGLSGMVEALSVRTIRLRASDGSVHIIPFSSVTSVTNVNRGLGNAAVSVSVAYDEDTDRVSQELTAVVAGMRADPMLSAMMLSDFELWGVDKVDGASATIAGQVVCTDSGRWAVQREFNRRMKRRFQELGIRIFNPVQTITLSAISPARTPAEMGNHDGHAQQAN